MSSFRISITPSKRAAGRFVSKVRRTLQKALLEENKKTGLTQAEIARKIGVHRSVINRELHGRKDIGVGRIGEFAWAMGRTPLFDLPQAPVEMPAARSEAPAIKDSQSGISGPGISSAVIDEIRKQSGAPVAA